MSARTSNEREGAASRRPLRAIAYTRVSTDVQAAKGFGLEVQRDAVRAYATEHGLDLVDTAQEGHQAASATESCSAGSTARRCCA
jgi:hypothetical protein